MVLSNEEQIQAMTSPDTPLQETEAEEPPLRFLHIKDVAARVALSERTIYNLVDSGEFPKPVCLTQVRRAFVEAEVIAWQRQKMEARA